MLMKNKGLIETQFIGSCDGDVTGSKTLLKVDGLNIMVDFGAFQEGSSSQENFIKDNIKQLPKIKYDELDYIIISHSHLDHMGLVPCVTQLGFNGRILTTSLTSDIGYLNLIDSAYIQERECAKLNLKRKESKIHPLYTKEDVNTVMDYIQGYNYYQAIQLSDNVSLEFLPNGHIPGSAMIYLEYRVNEFEKKRVLITGDTSCGKEKPFTKYDGLNKKKIDLIICESTYGKSDKVNYNPLKQLENEIINTVINNKGTLVLPTFAVGRSTELLYMMKKIYDKNGYGIPLYFASPSAIKTNKEILKNENKCFYNETWHKEIDNLRNWDKVKYIDSFEDVQCGLVNNDPKIIITCSGMGDKGYANFLIQHYITKKRNCIMFTGYCVEGTVGGKLLSHIQKTIALSGKQFPIKCKIDKLEGMSSHATGQELVEMFSGIEKRKVKKICIIHGNDDNRNSLKDRFEKEFKSAKVFLPSRSQVIKI